MKKSLHEIVQRTRGRGTAGGNLTIDLGDGADRLFNYSAAAGTVNASGGWGRDWIEGGVGGDDTGLVFTTTNGAQCALGRSRCDAANDRSIRKVI